MIACKKRNIDIINVFLSAGADPAIVDADGETCLHCAVHNNCCTEIFQAIISHGGDVNATGKNNRTALLIACKKGNKDAINVLLNAGADPTIPDAHGGTCLHIAAAAYHNDDDYYENDSFDYYAVGDTCLHYDAQNGCCTEVLQAIISHGGDVNATCSDTRTALMLACTKGNIDAINVLLNDGADPNISDCNGEMSLHYAVLNDCCTEILQAIISHGGDVNKIGKDNRTVLMLACKRGNKDAINVPLNAGADPNIAATDGYTCLHEVVRQECSKEVLLAMIYKGANMNATNRVNQTSLMLASEKGNDDAINVLINAGADANITDADGNTCLQYASRNECCKEVLLTIISQCVDVNGINKSNVTALMIACLNRNEDGINILLNAGADPNITDSKGATCIHHAVGGGCSKEMLLRLIIHGANVNAKSTIKKTALMVACLNGNEDAVKLLLNAGADPNISDADGCTSLHDAVDKGFSRETLQLIMNHGADVNATNKYNETALLVACQKLNADAISVLLNVRADPTIADYEGYTCLHHWGCSKENLQAMIDHGADVNATNKKSITPLMHACENGDVDAINILLDAGADPNIADEDGYTSLHDAVEGFCSTESLRAIIDHGADVNAINKNSVTAIMIACYKGNTDAISILLNAGADLNMTDGNGATCIHHVVGEGFTKAMLETVINHGADVNATNKNNVTALMIACLNSNEDAINVLLNAGANSNIADADGDSCLHNAVGKSCIADSAIADYEGYTCLHHGGCSKENLQAMMDHGANVNATNKNNRTPLMH